MKSIFPQNFQDIVLFPCGIQHCSCGCQCHSASECDFYMIFSNTWRAVWNLALMWSLLFLISGISYEYSLWRASLFTSGKCVIYLSIYLFLIISFSAFLFLVLSFIRCLAWVFFSTHFFLTSLLSFLFWIFLHLWHTYWNFFLKISNSQQLFCHFSFYSFLSFLLHDCNFFSYIS